MHPSFNWTIPFGPTIVIGAEPAISPDSLTGGFTFNVKLSVFDISTWEWFLRGPKTLTPSIALSDGPMSVSCSLHAYCPGWDKSFNGVSS